MTLRRSNLIRRVVLKKFDFPRQIGGEGVCLADYFAPVSSGRMDVVAFQVVTVGPGATARFAELETAGEYSEAYFLHGLAVQMAEATANYLHAHILQELKTVPQSREALFLGVPGHPGPGRPPEGV